MRKVVVVGGSAGGIGALCEVLKGLPTEFSAPLLAVIHLGEGGSFLREVLQRCTNLEVVSPKDPQPINAGRVYIASPNRHLTVRDGCVMTSPGPRENRHRPAIDVLFRSAARSYRSDVVAVVLSGALDDGVAGSLAVKARGGTVIIQDPEEATTPDMPANVLRRVRVDHALRLADMGPFLARLAANGEPSTGHGPTPQQCQEISVEEAMANTDPLAYTCPECGGSLLKVDQGGFENFRCNVGHTYSLESFSYAHSHALERALWTAVQRLNEQRSIQEHLARRTSDPQLQKRHQENAEAAEEDMRLLKEILARL